MKEQKYHESYIVLMQMFPGIHEDMKTVTEGITPMFFYDFETFEEAKEYMQNKNDVEKYGAVVSIKELTPPLMELFEKKPENFTGKIPMGWYRRHEVTNNGSKYTFFINIYFQRQQINLMWETI